MATPPRGGGRRGRDSRRGARGETRIRRVESLGRPIDERLQQARRSEDVRRKITFALDGAQQIARGGRARASAGPTDNDAPTAARRRALPRVQPDAARSIADRRGWSGSLCIRRPMSVSRPALVGPKPLEERERCVHAVRSRRLEPVERAGDRRPRPGCRAPCRRDPRAGSPARDGRGGDRPGATA